MAMENLKASEIDSSTLNSTILQLGKEIFVISAHLKSIQKWADKFTKNVELIEIAEILVEFSRLLSAINNKLNSVDILNVGVDKTCGRNNEGTQSSSPDIPKLKESEICNVSKSTSITSYEEESCDSSNEDNTNKNINESVSNKTKKVDSFLEAKFPLEVQSVFDASRAIRNLIKGCTVTVEHFESPSEFYIFFNNTNFKLQNELKDKLKTIQPFQKKLKGNCAANKVLFKQEIGTDVLYYSICEESWYRAKVINWYLEFNDEFVSIFNLDNGETKCVSITHLYCMPNDLKDYPIFMQRCHLGNICPVIDEDDNGQFKWMKNVTEELRYWIEDASKTVIKMTSADDVHPPSSIPVTLWLSGKEKSVNDLLIEKNMALAYTPPETLTKTSPRNSNIDDWNPMQEDFESPYNMYNFDITHSSASIYGYVGNDYNTVCWQFNNLGQCYKGKGCRKEHITLNPLGYTTDREEIFKEAFKKLPTPEIGDMFPIEITHILRADQFFCIFETATLEMDDETLWSMNHFINTPNNLREMKKLLVPPAVGQIVLAMCSTGSKWYRAKVVESKPERDIFKIIFVDFGIEDLVPISRIRDIEAHYLHLPFQAFQCHIHGIEAVGTEGLEYFKNDVQNRTLIIEVVQILPGDHLNLFVHLYDDMKNNIAEELVAKNYAKFKTEIDLDPYSCVVPG